MGAGLRASTVTGSCISWGIAPLLRLAGSCRVLILRLEAGAILPNESTPSMRHLMDLI